MARRRVKPPAGTDADAAREEIRRHLQKFREELTDDPVPAEEPPQMEAVRRAVTYSGPVPIR